MEFANRWSEESTRWMMQKLFLGTAFTLALAMAGAGILRAQEPPEPPEPPAPPEAPQVFVLNDGAAHLGVTLGDVNAAKAQELKLPAVAGAVVQSVQKDSAAAKAGLQVGDAIMEFDGVHVRSSSELRRLIRETPPGRTVEIKIMRDGKPRTLSAKLEASSNGSQYFNGPEIRVPPINIPEINIPPMNFPGFMGRHTLLGISGDDLTAQLAQYFGVKQGKGVLVSEVTQGGAADKAGLKAGDVIVQVDSKPVGSVEELREALQGNFTADTRKVTLNIVREHREMTLTAELHRTHLPQKLSTSGSLDPMYRQFQEGHSEWQKQFQDQMQALRDQLQEMRDVRFDLRQGGEI